MPSVGFEPAIPAGERLQTHALDHSAIYKMISIIRKPTIPKSHQKRIVLHSKHTDQTKLKQNPTTKRGGLIKEHPICYHTTCILAAAAPLYIGKNMC
jgi:hypothetical protein